MRAPCPASPARRGRHGLSTGISGLSRGCSRGRCGPPGGGAGTRRRGHDDRPGQPPGTRGLAIPTLVATTMSSRWRGRPEPLPMMSRTRRPRCPRSRRVGVGAVEGVAAGGHVGVEHGEGRVSSAVQPKTLPPRERGATRRPLRPSSRRSDTAPPRLSIGLRPGPGHAVSRAPAPRRVPSPPPSCGRARRGRAQRAARAARRAPRRHPEGVHEARPRSARSCPGQWAARSTAPTWAPITPPTVRTTCSCPWPRRSRWAARRRR